MFIVKKHESEGKKVLAIIDSELKGQSIEEGNKVLDVNNSFYDGEEKNLEEVKNYIKNAKNINAIGNKIVLLLKEMNLVDVSQKIADVEYAIVTLE